MAPESGVASSSRAARIATTAKHPRRGPSFLDRVPLFAALQPPHLKKVASLLETREAKAGERIVNQGDAGDSLYIVASGHLRVFVETGESGDVVILSTLGPYDTFGELALLDGQPRSASVEALDSVVLLTLRRDSFLELLGSASGLTEAVLASLAQVVRRLTDQTADVVLHDVHERVARLLLRLIEERGEQSGEQVILDLRATQNDVATVIGRTPHSVNEILRSFEHLGCLTLEDDVIVVRDFGTLHRQVREGFSWSELAEKVFHDPLTKLANRVLFRERVTSALSHAMRSGRPVAILFLDLDGFKAINDQFGHAAGDLVLQGVADRLRMCVRKPDTVARLGGDEFAVLLEDSASPKDAMIVARRIIESVRKPFTDVDAKARIGTSIGVSVFGPGNRVLAEDLLEQADAAMYAAKISGKGRFVVHGGGTPEAPGEHTPKAARRHR